MTTPFKGTLEFTSPINRDNSFTSVRIADDAASTIEVEVREDGTGWFEWDIASLEETYSGALEFEGNMLTGYDGLFELPKQLTDYLKANGFKMDQFIESED